MSKWPELSLFDFCNPKQWPTIPQTEFVETGYPVYGANGKIGHYSEFNHEKPTVLITCRGATCGTINVCDPMSYVTGNSMALDDLDESKVCLEYLVYALRQRSLSQAITGTAQPQITRQSLTAISVVIPPLAEQRRIAAVLDAAEALRAKRRVALAKLDSLTQSIFLEMFGDPAVNAKEWPTVPLSSLVRDDDTINYGVIQPGDDVPDGIPLIRVGDLIAGRVRHTELKKITRSIEAAYTRSRLRGDEILVSCVGSIGVVVLAHESEKGFNVARAVARIPLADATNRVFLSEYLRTDFVQRYFVNELRTVSQPTLNIKQLSETLVVLPPLELQESFANRVATLDKLKSLHVTSLIQLDALFVSLQHRAFRGEL